jgi:hypothetical protein
MIAETKISLWLYHLLLCGGVNTACEISNSNRTSPISTFSSILMENTLNSLILSLMNTETQADLTSSDLEEQNLKLKNNSKNLLLFVKS